MKILEPLRLLLAIALLAVGSTLALGATAPAPPPDPNATCLMCHGSADAKNAAGASIAVDAAKFGASVHGQMQLPCNACHANVAPDKIPHGENAKVVECGNCHTDAVKQYNANIHGMARAGGNKVAATCTNCHGSHDIRRTTDPASLTSRANVEATCGACHGNDALVEKAKLPGGNIVRLYHDSIHGKAIDNRTATKDIAPTCVSCHGAHDARPKSDPTSRVARANIPDTCGGCHTDIRAKYRGSQHGKLRQDNNLASPGCTDCHSAHHIQRHDLPQWQLEVIGECGTCHTEYIGTYRDTFHGQVTRLGYTRVATCNSCHGAHEVLPADNPASKVSAQNRVATCQACHPKANANFAMYDPHANRHRREGGELLFFTGKFMEWLLIGVFTFFGLHTVLWFVRSLREVRAHRRGPENTDKEGRR